MWLTYYVPGGDAELNGRLSAWSGYRTAVAPLNAELRAARAANMALAAENTRLRTALDEATARLAEREGRIREQVYTVAHHVRTPLGLIKGYVGTLLNGDLALDARGVREFLEIIDEETDAVSRLVNQVLELARLESGPLRIDAGPVDLACLVREQVSRARRPALPPVRLDLARGLPAAWGDRARIEPVLAELLDNAARHSPPGAGIAVRARPTFDGGAVQVTVQDSGPGIPPAALPRLFKPFYRVAPGDSRQGGGVGLGLYLAHGWIAAHGGRLWAENAPEGGAAFHFTVPTVAAARTQR